MPSFSVSPWSLAGLDRQTAGVLARRIVRAADETAVAAELQPQPAVAAGGAGARVAAVLARGEEMRAQILVQRVDHVADLEVLGLIDRLGELVPERAHHRPPVGLARRRCRRACSSISAVKPVFDVVLEEADQERGDQPAAILRDEAPLLQPDIFAVLQHRQDGGVGGGPADAQFLHLLDQARLGIARRRLGEVLVAAFTVAALQRVAFRHRRQHAALVLLRRRRPDLRDTASGSRRTPRSSRWRAASDPCRPSHRRDLVKLGRLHLRGDGALPDQLIKPALVGAQVARRRCPACGPHRWGGSPRAPPARSSPCCVFARRAPAGSRRR